MNLAQMIAQAKEQSSGSDKLPNGFEGVVTIAATRTVKSKRNPNIEYFVFEFQVKDSTTHPDLAGRTASTVHNLNDAWGIGLGEVKSGIAAIIGVHPSELDASMVEDALVDDGKELVGLDVGIRTAGKTTKAGFEVQTVSWFEAPTGEIPF